MNSKKKNKKEKIKRILINICSILIISITITLSGWVFLGIKFNNFWYCLIAAIAVYFAMKFVTSYRKKILKDSEKIGKNISKKISKRYEK